MDLLALVERGGGGQGVWLRIDDGAFCLLEQR
jgi:hypothetical protein